MPPVVGAVEHGRGRADSNWNGPQRLTAATSHSRSSLLGSCLQLCGADAGVALACSGGAITSRRSMQSAGGRVAIET